MNNEQLNGKIEGLAYALAALIADMEIREIINGPRYCQHLYTEADRIRGSSAHAQSETVRFHAMTLHNLAASLDSARAGRIPEDDPWDDPQ